MTRTPQEELVHFLSDLYAMELQAIVQMEEAPDLAGVAQLAEDFRVHHRETVDQAERVGARLEALNGSSSSIKEAVMKLGGKGFVLFARLQPETPGKLITHAYSYEAMEWAGYEVLLRLAEFTGDSATATLAHEIQQQERAMMKRLEHQFDEAEACSHHDTPPEAMAGHVCKHLAEAHALEAQSLELLKKAPDIAGDEKLARIYADHLEETRRQAGAVERRLRALGGRPSTLEDAALRLGALNWGQFFRRQSDTPMKLAAFAFAVEHLEIGGYELLRRTARRAGDPETRQLCDKILEEERSMCARLAGAFADSVRTSIDTLKS